MSIKNVKNFFKKFNIENRILEFDVSSATVELAAKAINCEEARIAKSIAFKIEEKPILIVMTGDVKVDNAKYKKEFGKKAKMLTHEETELLIGHKVGGVCPFAINDGVEVYLDNSLKKFDTVFPACGSANSAIELNIEEMEKYSNFSKWVDVTKI